MAGDDLDFETLDPRYRRFIADALAGYGLDPVRFCRPLPAGDEMFFRALLPNYQHDHGIAAFKFTEATLRYFDAYRQVVDQAFGGFGQLESVMDFASGYGRLTRVLEQKLRADQLWVSDIQTAAVDWQVAAFGVNGVYSTTDPSAFSHERRHDLVFVGSLFSHLPAPLFRAWLARLYAMLTPRGVLAFSVHDESLLPPGLAADPSGLTFEPVSESVAVDPEVYGMSYVSVGFVRAAIAGLPGSPSWARHRKGLYENQDLYVVGGRDRDVSDVRVASTPMGGFETALVHVNGDVEFTGWAIERTPWASIARLAVSTDEAERGEAERLGERPDVLVRFPGAASMPVGWRFRLRRAETQPGALVRLRMKSTSGLAGAAYVEFPEATAMTYSGWTRRAIA